MVSTLMIATVLAAFLSGGIPALAAVLKPGLANQLQAEPSRSDGVLRWLPIGWIVFMPLAGWMIDGWGAQAVLFCGLLGLALALGMLAMGRHILAASATVTLLALASALVTVASASLMPWALLRELEFPAGSFGLGFTAVSLGYLLTVWLWPHLERRFTFQQALLCLGLACLLPAALVPFIPPEAFPPAHPHAFLSDWSSDPRMWLVGLAVFLYFSLEQVLDVWTRPFLTELGHKERIVPYLLAGFWIAFLATRLSAGWIMRPNYEGWFLVSFLLISSMVLGNLAGAYAPNSGIAGFWLAGACYGPLLPTLLAIVYSVFENKAPAAALGTMFSLAAINFLAFRPWFVAYSQARHVRAAMRIPMVLGLMMAAVTLVLTLIR